MSELISPTSTVPVPQAPQPDSATSLTKLADDYNRFLELLTAQVSNQDPLEPMDSSTFVTQLAQLSQVEQTVKANSNLENISAQIASANSMRELDLIGHKVTVTGNNFEAGDLPVELGYSLAAEADSVAINILASDGTVVDTLVDMPTTPGTTHKFAWAGPEDNGEPMRYDGFSVEVVASDENEEPIAHTGYVQSRVDGVIMGDAGSELSLGNGDTVDVSRILEVS